jgi:hypothetical protein
LVYKTKGQRHAICGGKNAGVPDSKEKNMKKTFVKLGLLAMALAFVLVSCAQPTEEAGGGTKAPTIIRLYLDRDDATLAPNDQFIIAVGEELYGYGNGNGNFPYASNPDAAGTVENSGRTNADAMTAANRKQVTSIPPDRAASTGTTVLQLLDPKKKVLSSGQVTVGATIAAGNDPAGTTIQVDAKGIYYVDVPLVNLTVASKDRGSVYAGSISGWVELWVIDIASPPPAPAFQLENKIFMYTKDKHGFNDLWKIDTNGAQIWKTTNSNIKKVSLKPGINELYLSYFSAQQAGN